MMTIPHESKVAYNIGLYGYGFKLAGRKNMIKKITSAVISASIAVTSFCMPLVSAEQNSAVASGDVSAAIKAEMSGFQIEKMQTEHLTNPIGIDAKAPVFSWIMKSDTRSQSQTAYQIFVADSEENLKNGNYVWDSGKKQSDLSNAIRYEGDVLKASSRYFWQVRVWNRDGAAVMSDVSFFETGLMDSGWGDAKWIGVDTTSEPFKQPRKDTEFTIDVDFIMHDGIFGLIFGTKDINNFYMWQVSTGKLSPHQWVNGSPKTFGEQPDLSGIFPTKEDAVEKTHHLTIKASNGNIKTYINSELVDERTVDSFELGYIGFRNAGVSFSIDNVVIKDGKGAVINNYDFEDISDPVFLTGEIIDGMNLLTHGCGDGLTFAADSELWPSAPMMRREFETTQGKEIESAKLYATSAGIYRMEINGKSVDDSYLNPGSTQYNKTLMYQTYDVTDLVSEGENAVAAMLGHGWFKKEYSNFGSRLGLYAKLLINYKDGTSETVVTDDNWKYSIKTPVVADDYYLGEVYNALLEQEGWSEPDFDDSKWYKVGVYDKETLGIGEIVAQDIERIRNTITLKPVAVTEPTPGVYIYDFGQNFAGIPRVKINSPEGQVIRFRYGEMLNLKDMEGGDGPEGTLYRKNLLDAYSIDRYIAKGTEYEVFEPNFVYHGFRYLEISGVDKQIPAEDVEGIVFHTALENTGTFESSNALINQLWQNTLWSQRSNFMSIPTDCPQRRERWGWTGDAHIFARTASYNMNTYQFFRKYLRDMRDGQTEDGKFRDVMPGTDPNVVWSFRGGNATSGWADAGVIIPWQMYLQYGDTTVIEENYDAMCKWIGYLVNDLEDPNVYIRERGWTGDWMSSGERTQFGVTDTAYCAYSSMLLSKMAELINKPEDAKKYAEIAGKFKSAWNSAYVNADGSTTCDTQVSYVLGLQFDLFPEELRANAANKLVENIKRNGNRLTTGFLGVSYLAPVLADAGHVSTAYTLLEQTERPSWLYSVTTGSTTIWEKWDSLVITPDGSSKVNETSFNHYSYGAICEWLYKGVAGIERDEENPAYKHIILKPMPGGSLNSAKATYDSPYGMIVSDWSVDNNTLTYKAEIPANTTATLYLPEATAVTESGKAVSEAEGVVFKGSVDGKAVYELQSGKYEFVQEITPWEVSPVYDNFTDVSESDWFYPYVKSVFKSRLMLGVSDTEFAPNESINRAMFVTMLYRMADVPKITTENKFTDVVKNSWYECAAIWTNANGIVNGKSETIFDPETPITGEEIATLIYRYATEFKKVEADESIRDTSAISGDVSEWAKEAVNYCLSAGIVDEGNVANLKNAATRAETAAMLVKFNDTLK